jgi:GTP-binding protein EngB required for normal cell division
MQNERQPQINIMVLGQTGVGKSALINYLYGAEAVKTGTGKPVTGRGDFTKITIPSPLKPGVKINIFDSWGLEPDKADDWEAVIDSKLSDTLSFERMIYGIVYCSAYPNDRVEDFEIAMLKEFLRRQYKVTIALTKADDSGYEKKRDVFRNIFDKELAEYRGRYSVVDVCAQAEPKLGQPSSQAKTFGKEELFRELERDFQANFARVLLYARRSEWKTKIDREITAFIQNSMKKIISFKGEFLAPHENTARQISSEIEKDFVALQTGIKNKVEPAVNELQLWYERTTGGFHHSRQPLFPILVEFPAVPLLLLQLFDNLRPKTKNELQQALFFRLGEAASALRQSIDKPFEKMYEKLTARSA